MAATSRLREQFRTKHDARNQFYLGTNPLTGTPTANVLLSTGMGGHSQEVLDNIDRALVKVTKDNRPLLDAYYRYYTRHALTNSLPWNMSDETYTGATKYGATDINPNVLKGNSSTFPTDDPSSLLGETQIHEFVHTPQDDPENPILEAKAYGIEKSFTERMGDSTRVGAIERRYSRSGRAERKALYEGYSTITELYEVINNGGRNAEEARNMVVEYITKNPSDFGPELKSLVSEVSQFYVP